MEMLFLRGLLYITYTNNIPIIITVPYTLNYSLEKEKAALIY